MHGGYPYSPLQSLHDLPFLQQGLGTVLLPLALLSLDDYLLLCLDIHCAVDRVLLPLLYHVLESVPPANPNLDPTHF